MVNQNVENISRTKILAPTLSGSIYFCFIFGEIRSASMAKHCQSFLSIRLESIESNLFELNFVVVYVELPNKGEWNTELSLQKLVLTGANKGPRNFNLLHLSEALPN